MALYLVQHGKSLPKDQDPDQPLSPEGRETVKNVAKTAKEHELVVTSIKHSGKTRARQTAEIFADHLSPAEGVQQIDGITPMDDVSASDIIKLIEDSDNLMLVGHLPFMEKLTSYLVTGNYNSDILKFQNGNIVCLKKKEAGKWSISWIISTSYR